MQNKTPKNDKHQRHGYWEIYYPNGQLDHKGLYINDKRFGKFERYRKDGSMYYVVNYINNELHGYYDFHWSDGRIDKEYHAK